MKFQDICKIIHNNKLTPNIYHLKIFTPKIALHSKPGQFVHIKCQESVAPLLRRPMSIFNADKENIEIIYRVHGEGTHILSKKKKGDFLDIIGTLGNGFSLPKKSYSLIVGGGMGLVPLYYLAKTLKQKNEHFEVFMGAKTKQELVTLKFYKSITKEIKISTDDGSAGFHGNTVFLLDKYLEKQKAEFKIYSCGPKPMLIAIQQLADKYKIFCEISLEEYMGCGVGACLSCVCKSKDNKYKRVCVEGPVFKSSEVIL